MSIIQSARVEMKIAGFPEDEIKAMEQILHIFFDNWDSGGAVHAMAPVLQRLIAGKPLGPLMDIGSEWMEVATDTYQNIRCSTVFKTISTNAAYDIDTPGRPPITFPYWPKNSEVSSPVMEIEVPDATSPLSEF